MMRASLLSATLVAVVALGSAGQTLAESSYTKVYTDACEETASYEDGAVDIRCPGYQGIDVYINGGDARTDVDFGVKGEAFETFSAFNDVAETVEWMLDEAGDPYAAAIRFKISVDGREAEALVVSRIGSDDAPGCVVGVVDAATEQANGVARGLGAMAKNFDCARDQVVVVPGARELVRAFSGANS